MEKIEALKKALKFKIHSEQGDNKELALKKYNEFLIDNQLTSFEVNDFRKQNEIIPKKTFTILGKTYSSKEQFQTEFKSMSFFQKIKLAKELVKLKSPKKK